MRNSPWKSFLRRVTTDQWQQLLLVIGLVAFSVLVDPPYRRYWWLVALGFATMFIVRGATQAFFTMHTRYAPPRRGHIAAVNSAIGLVLIWGSVLWLDHNSSMLLRQWLRWDVPVEMRDGFPWSRAVRSPRESGDAADGWLIDRVDSRNIDPNSQRVIVQDLVIRGFFCVPFLMWTLQLLNRVFRETFAVPRPWRVIALGVMTAVVCFLVVWRFVPWDVIWGPNRDFAVKWLCVTWVLGLIAAAPISEQV